MRLLPVICALSALLLQVQPGATQVPGLRPDGSVLLPNQWTLRPVGKQVEIGDFPVNIAMHPSGAYIAILHCGYGQHEIVVMDLAKTRVISRTNIQEGFYGVTFSPDGDRLFCSGAGQEVVHTFSFAGGLLSEPGTLPLRNVKQRGIPSGLAITADGSTLYVANLWSHSISRQSLAPGAPAPSEVLLISQPVATPALPAPTGDEPSITKRAEALLELAAADPFPYMCVLDEARRRLYVSLWGQAEVAVIDLEKFTVSTRWKVEEHPNEMLLSLDKRFLFVANANRNSVSVIDVEAGRVVETLIAQLQPGALPGNTPNSMALAPDGKRLFVANANINTVSVFDIAEIGKSRSLGFIPVGWYPTSVRITPDGKKLLVANGKGIISKSNRHGPVPGLGTTPGLTEYIGGLFQGTLSFIDLPAEDAFAKRLAEWTARAFQCQPEATRRIREADVADSPIPRKPGDKTPIKYVIYVVKENRTFDQVLGDIGRGNADPSLCLFPEAITPNHHALAREFVLLDNFYVESEVSADGHEWTFGAYATDFVEKHWPLGYGHNAHKKIPYVSEGGMWAMAKPAGGYIWDRAKEAGVSYRSYGEFVSNPGKNGEPATTKVPALQGNFDPEFRSFDMDYPDVKRAERFISELRRFEAEGDMPRLQIVRLPNDHTAGASPGKWTPQACMADNDLAFGQIVEAVSRSKFWPETAIFVVEDDAQNGPDHVDAHRTIAYVISPYSRRGALDSTLYSTSSMLRTIELVLGLLPMSQFDAAAMPMFASFQPKPDLTPYLARPVTVDLNERNLATAWGAKESLAMDFSKEDAADDLLLNQIIWRAVRGPDSPMPAPQRAAFVFIEQE